MNDQILEKLRSTNAVQRRQAVVAVANSNDPDAVDILTRVASNDDDPAIRDLAARAADHVRKAAWQKAQDNSPLAKAAPAAAPSAAIARTEGNATTKMPDKPAEIIVPENKRKIAKGRLNSAFSARVDGKNDKAIVNLRKAVQLDPGLAKDGAAMALAADLMSSTSEEAMNKLMGYDDPSVQNQAAKAAGAAAGNVFLFIGEAILLLGAQMAIPALLIGSAVTLAAKYSTATDLNQLAAEMQILTTPTFLLRLVAGYILQSLFLYTVMFFVGASMGGTGSLMNFVRTMMRVTTGITVGIWLFVLLPLVLPDFTKTLNLPNNALTFFLILGLLTVGIEAYFAGRAHGFGIFRGCATLFAGTFAAACILSLFVNFLIRPGLAR